MDNRATKWDNKVIKEANADKLAVKVAKVVKEVKNMTKQRDNAIWTKVFAHL